MRALTLKCENVYKVINNSQSDSSYVLDHLDLASSPHVYQLPGIRMSDFGGERPGGGDDIHLNAGEC